MAGKKIFVDETRREISEHGTAGFPVTVNHDDLWMFEGKTVPVHWHSDLEIGLPREGKATYQIYQNRYTLKPGEGILINSNVPHSCCSPDNRRVKYHSIILRPDFLYGDFGSDVEKNCFRPFLQNHAVPCLLFRSEDDCGTQLLQLLDQVDSLFCQRPPCFELLIKGLLCQAFGLFFSSQSETVTEFVPENKIDLDRLEKMLYYIHTHYESVFSLQKLADEIHLSREVCCRLFKKMTGRTITRYLEEYRVSQSLPLVQSGQYSMARIAELTGFSNSSRFAHAFKDHIGCNPGDYNSLNQSHLL